jgi:hypothetical protein
MTQVTQYPYADQCPRSPSYSVLANGKEVFVYRATAGDFAAFACDGPVEVVIASAQMLANVRVLPLARKIVPIIDGQRLTLQLPGSVDLLIEAAGVPNLFIYASHPSRNQPTARGGKVRVLQAGHVHDFDEIHLGESETLHLEGGAVARGCVRANRLVDSHISGCGILDDSPSLIAKRNRRSITFEGCRDGSVSDIIMIEPSMWMLSLAACRNMTVSGIRQIGSVYSSDGIDIVGSQDIRISNCMLRNGDDCIAIKSLSEEATDGKVAWGGQVRNIEVTDCSLLVYRGGCAIDIGHETRTDVMEDIRFRNISVMGVHEYGAPFGIHNADRACIRNVLFEKFHVEHHYDKLVDFRIVRSRWSRDTFRGAISNVVLKDINVDLWPYNTGYSISVIGGFDEQHRIDNIDFDNFRIGGKLITAPDEMDLYTKHAGGITFRGEQA